MPYDPREEVVPNFWRYFQSSEEPQPLDQEEEARRPAFHRFERAVAALHASVAAFIPGLQDLARLWDFSFATILATFILP
jgi:hypothetical protein